MIFDQLNQSIMITIFLFFFIASILTVSVGNFFLNIIYKKNYDYKFSLSESGIVGFIFVSFISLLLNFFFKIDQLVASILFIFPIFLLIRIYKKKEIEFLKNIILHLNLSKDRGIPQVLKEKLTQSLPAIIKTIKNSRYF